MDFFQFLILFVIFIYLFSTGEEEGLLVKVTGSQVVIESPLDVHAGSQ